MYRSDSTGTVPLEKMILELQKVSVKYLEWAEEKCLYNSIFDVVLERVDEIRPRTTSDTETKLAKEAQGSG
jgi:hypothetical protein